METTELLLFLPAATRGPTGTAFPFEGTSSSLLLLRPWGFVFKTTSINVLLMGRRKWEEISRWKCAWKSSVCGDRTQTELVDVCVESGEFTGPPWTAHVSAHKKDGGPLAEEYRGVHGFSRTSGSAHFVSFNWWVFLPESSLGCFSSSCDFCPGHWVSLPRLTESLWRVSDRNCTQVVLSFSRQTYP